jgi:Fuc2NAc and GlcNAc transferase
LSLGLFIGAWALTGGVRRYALATRLLDLPNARSSHSIPTPRGGGMAIVVMALLTLPLLGWLGALSWSTVSGMVGGGALVAAVGFVDDHGHIRARWRLTGQFAAAAWIVTQLGGAPDISFLGRILGSGWVSHVLATFYLVWLSNLFNFMDGIDGIAGVETLTVCAGAALTSLLVLPGNSQWLAPVVIASATLGFLVWNWPPAKIFMGDAGAAFLGLILGALSLDAARTEPRLFWSWAILSGVFIVDATVTLIRRVLRREKFYEAHRSHAYQHAAVRWGGHRPVTITVGAITLGWLFPIALMAGLGLLDGLVATLIAYAPLVAVALWLDAGRPNGGKRSKMAARSI